MGHTIVLERGHVGRTGGRPSATHGELVEDRLTRGYGDATEDCLRNAGHEVIVISDGTYRERQLRASAYGARIYVARHTNAGAHDYGACFYDHRSALGRALAEFVVMELGRLAPLAMSGGAKAVPARPDDWTRNTFATIHHCYDRRPIGLCFEPGFIDQPAHRELWTPEGLVLVGRALATGILTFMESAA
mgnify:CR=1 FL=1